MKTRDRIRNKPLTSKLEKEGDRKRDIGNES